MPVVQRLHHWIKTLVEESGTYKRGLYLYVGHAVATNNTLQHPLSNSFDSSKLQGFCAVLIQMAG